MRISFHEENWYYQCSLSITVWLEQGRRINESSKVDEDEGKKPLGRLDACGCLLLHFVSERHII